MNKGKNMKQYTKIALAVLALTSAGIASADVEMYGKASAGIGKTYTHSVKNVKVDDQGSYIGFKGNESLSDQAKAIWQVEQAVQLDGDSKGQSYVNSLRDSYVGLQHNKLGTVKVGKNTSSYKEVGSELDLFRDETASVEAGYGRFNQRIKNSVKYDTPDVYGLSGSVTYGTAENREANSKVKSDVYSTALNYQLNDKFKVGAGYERRNDILGSSDYSYGVKAATSYEFGNGALVGTGAERIVYNPKHEAGKRQKQDAVTVSGVMPVGNVDLQGNYTRLFDARGQKDTGANIYTVGAKYNLSKRTALGSYYSMIDNDKNGAHDFANNGVTTDNNSVLVGENVRSFGATLSHKF